MHDTKTSVQSVDETKSKVANKCEDLSEFEEVQLKSNQEDSDSTYDNCKVTYNTNTLTLTRVKIGDIDDEADKRSKFKEDGKSVVSYDSIYLSSEDSNDRTIVQEIVEDPLPDVTVNKTGEFHEADEDQPSLDSLYSQISKSKPKIISLEPKTRLTSFSDTSNRGTLERLTFISTTPQTQKKDYSQIEGKRFSEEPFVGTLIDNQYCSLPDVSIGLSLHASERIDEKLRLSCKVTSDNSTNTYTIHDSISQFGKAHKQLRQRRNVVAEETKSVSIEEALKEAEVIEVTPPNKPIENFTSDSIEKQAKPQGDLPTTINLGKKKIIVDELAARNHKSLRDIESETTRTTKFSDIKIIVTDAQNNVVEEEDFSKETHEVKEIRSETVQPIKQPEVLPNKQTNKQSTNKQSTNNQPTNNKPTNKQSTNKQTNNKQTNNQPTNNKPSNNQPTNNQTTNPTQATVVVKQDDRSTKPIKTETKDKPRPHPVGLKQIQIKKQLLKKTNSEQRDLRSEFKANLTDTLRKRIQESRNIFNARPIRISSEEHIEKLNDTYEINSSLAYKVKFKEQTKMSRPQILTVVDSKRNVCSVAPRQAGDTHDTSKCNKNQSPQSAAKILQPEGKQEFKEKVDSVRCYWSKLIEENGHDGVDEVDHEVNEEVRNESVRNYIASVEKQNQENAHKNRNGKAELRDNEDFTSYSPSVEIIELDGQKHAAVVKSQNTDTQDFDHVRYKVMKSDTFQKNILAHNRKEAQFDGLLQYLHNYSFQVRQSIELHTHLESLLH